ncbi:hypothetical protein DFJ77DRAFT_488310 [Powellomyces hirtus]|nr:hypothetical protein DFJ77DRAFT_488310 [Powellomyces hirtus]
MSRIETIRATYYGAVGFNFVTLLLPALYGTLSKLWIAQLAPSQVVTTDVYTYVGVITEVVNEGLSRVAFNVIGNKHRTDTYRRQLCWTLIAFQALCGLLLSVAFVVAAPSFASLFVPVEVRDNSITYVRIASFSSLFSVIQYATEAATRSLDRPDVPLLISVVKTILNIALDLLFLSTVRVWTGNPDANTQGGIRLFCDGIAALVGLAYFAWTARGPGMKPSLVALKELSRPATFTLAESAIRNALYLWQVANIVSLGSDYATAWGVFNTIRWGILMVPAGAFEQAALAFIGHAWGKYKVQAAQKGSNDDADVNVVRPAMISFLYTLIIEAVLALLMSFVLIKPFAQYLSGDAAVAELTTRMFKQLDWCYVLFTVHLQLGAILLATRLDIWFVTALSSNILWVLPWCIALAVGAVSVDRAWYFYGIIFGGGLVLNFFVVSAGVGFWWFAVPRNWKLRWLTPLHD